ncbi:MAG TPA: glutamate--cysteine ligase [Acetobacteraceae bacterium]|nr:glutamate--cysteine ligase [Acetobacteraceae bacterium]
MSNPGDADTTPITSVRQLADYFAAGCKPRSRFRIGTEHEKFGFRRDDLSPPPYEPSPGHPGSIRLMLDGLARQGGEPILDGANPIGLKLGGGASVSLEPAGQLELSGAPLETLHETKAEFDAHFAAVREAAAPLGMGFAPLGFHPTMARADMPWMPKGRYAIMRAYMPKVGGLGLDMMTRTCTVQVNLDFASETDMRRKLRASLVLQPLATALFANSPFANGRPNGFLSYRAHVWTDTDNDRSGIPAVMLEDGFGFERYAAWLVDEVPMYFVWRDGRYIDVAGASFRAFMDGQLANLVGTPATVGDFADHVTTAFPDVRLKRFLEMRGADAGTPEMMLAQSALWVGLLYDEAALEAVLALIRDVAWEDAVAARDAVPRLGLDTPFRGHRLRDWAGDVLAIALDGLRARARTDLFGRDERLFLDPLRAIVDKAPTQAEHWLEQYRGPWNGNVGKIFALSDII